MKTAHRCCGTIFDGITFRVRQCSKMAKFDRDGKWYCGTHDPVAIELKAAAKLQKWKSELEANRKDLEEKEAAQKEMERKAALCDELLEALEAAQRLLERIGFQSSDEYQANAYAMAKAKGERQ